MQCVKRGFKRTKCILAILATVPVWLIITWTPDIQRAPVCVQNSKGKSATVLIQDSDGCEARTDLVEEWRNGFITKEDLNLYTDLERGYQRTKRNVRLPNSNDSNKTINRCLVIKHNKKGLEKVMNEQNFNGVHCPLKKASFSDNIERHTALASIPGSGNTWTRHLIEYISGIHTGSVYNDKTLAPEFGGEGHTDRVIAIKTHFIRNLNYDDVVLIIRNPRDAILSWYNYKTTKSHTANTEEALFNKTDWSRFVSAATNKWRHFYLTWMNDFKGRKMLLSYSRLQQDFFNELPRLADFLNISMSYKSLWCAFGGKEGSYRRRSHIDKNKVFNKYMMDNIDRAIGGVKAAVSRVLGDDAAEFV